MSTTAELDPIRPIDRARAAQIVCGQVTRDDEMISAAVQDTFADDWGFGECGSLINVIRALSEDVEFRPTGIAIALDGSVYVSDGLNNRIQKFSVALLL